MTHVCPKCYGDTELILTNRDAEGWLIGAMRRMTCNYCDGAGTVEAARAKRVYEVINHPDEPAIIAPATVKPLSVSEAIAKTDPLMGWVVNAFETTELEPPAKSWIAPGFLSPDSKIEPKNKWGKPS